MTVVTLLGLACLGLGLLVACLGIAVDPPARQVHSRPIDRVVQHRSIRRPSSQRRRRADPRTVRVVRERATAVIRSAASPVPRPPMQRLLDRAGHPLNWSADRVAAVMLAGGVCGFVVGSAIGLVIDGPFRGFIVGLVAALLAAVEKLPETLDRAVRVQWPGFTDFAKDAVSLFVLGRGPSYPIAQETALKLKETCAIHAEAYSVAEVMHGPWELMGADFPVLVYAPDDAAYANTEEAAAKMRAAGADVRVAGNGLPVAASGHPLLDPVSMIATAYLEIEKVAVALGRNPDRPRLLKKVTETT